MRCAVNKQWDVKASIRKNIKSGKSMAECHEILIDAIPGLTEERALEIIADVLFEKQTAKPRQTRRVLR